MNKTSRLLILTILFATLCGGVHAQLRQSVFLNGNIPTGDFGTSASATDLSAYATPLGVAYPGSGVPLSNTQVGKDASVGFGVGYRVSYRFDVGVGEVAPFGNIDFLWNTIDGSWRDKYDDAYYSAPTYFNIPLLGGVTYIYDELPWRDISAYGEFGVGTDLFIITSEGKGDGNERFGYKANFAFAWMLGAGAYFGQHFSAGLYYYGMGKHPVDYTSGTRDDNAVARAQAAAQTSRQQRTVGSVMLRLGFHF